MEAILTYDIAFTIARAIAYAMMRYNREIVETSGTEGGVIDAPFQIVPVPADAAQAPEAMGSKPKFWFSRDGEPWLFKRIRANTGEDWAEKVSEGLCGLLNVPHASYDLATWRDTRGVISRSFQPRTAAIVFGNEILFRVVPDYPRKKKGSRVFYRVPQHTVDLVMEVMENPAIQVPTDWEPPEGIESSADVFCGYMLLDAWIGNTDRHHENWAIVLRPSEADRIQMYLAPTFDHASSLGSHITDLERSERMTTRDQGRSMEAFARRASSPFFQSKDAPKPLTTLDAFREAARRRPRAAQAWLNSLATISDEAVEHLISRIPEERMSRPASQFATKLLQLNRRRLLENAGS